MSNHDDNKKLAAALFVTDQDDRERALIDACNDMKKGLNLWLDESKVMSDYLFTRIKAGVESSELEAQEQKLKKILAEECQILVYYCAGLSQLVSDSVGNCTDIDDTYRLSLDYYSAMDEAALQIIDWLDSGLLEVKET